MQLGRFGTDESSTIRWVRRMVSQDSWKVAFPVLPALEETSKSSPKRRPDRSARGSCSSLSTHRNGRSRTDLVHCPQRCSYGSNLLEEVKSAWPAPSSALTPRSLDSTDGRGAGGDESVRRAPEHRPLDRRRSSGRAAEVPEGDTEAEGRDRTCRVAAATGP